MKLVYYIIGFKHNNYIMYNNRGLCDRVRIAAIIYYMYINLSLYIVPYLKSPDDKGFLFWIIF